MVKYISLLLFIFSSAFPNFVYSQAKRQLVADVQQPSVSEKYPKMEDQQPLDQDQYEQMLKQSAAAASAWLKLLDNQQYHESWSAASDIFRIKIPGNEWTKLMERIRQPYGRAISRELMEQQIKVDPRGLPRGYYAWILYNTTFANKPSGVEFLTLRKEGDGWKVLTYQVK